MHYCARTRALIGAFRVSSARDLFAICSQSRCTLCQGFFLAEAATVFVRQTANNVAHTARARSHRSVSLFSALREPIRGLIGAYGAPFIRRMRDPYCRSCLSVFEAPVKHVGYRVAIRRRRENSGRDHGKLAKERKSAGVRTS